MAMGGTGEVLTVQHHRQRAGNGSCTWYSIVDSGQGREEYGVQHRGQWIEDRRDAEGLQHRGQRASGMCTGFSTMERGRGDGRGADGSAPQTESGEWEWELYGVQHREQRVGTGVGDVWGSAPWTADRNRSGVCKGFGSMDSERQESC